MEHERDQDYMEKLIRLNRCAKVVKGGRRFSFSALIVVGDKHGKVGFGFGKANDVSDAIRKSIDRAKKNMFMVPVKKNTIPHEIIGRYKSARIVLKPAAPGAGIIAGGPLRAVMEAAGVNDILSKSLGSKNQMNILKAVFNGIENLMDARKMSRDRGKPIKELWG